MATYSEKIERAIEKLKAAGAPEGVIKKLEDREAAADAGGLDGRRDAIMGTEGSLDELEEAQGEKPWRYEKRTDEEEITLAGSIFDKYNPPAWETVFATGIYDGLMDLMETAAKYFETSKWDEGNAAFYRGMINGTLEALDYMAEALEKAGDRDTEYAEEALKALENQKASILERMLKQ